MKILIAAKIIKEYHPRIAGHLDKCNRAFLELKRECEGCRIYSSIDKLIQPLERLSSVISEYLEDHQEGPCRDEILTFYFDISRFLTIYELLDDKYVIYGEFEDDGGFVIKLFSCSSIRLAITSEGSTCLYS